jgi:hypothetical protein
MKDSAQQSVNDILRIMRELRPWAKWSVEWAKDDKGKIHINVVVEG